MNSKKMVLLAVMVIAVGLFALPNTVQFIEEVWKEIPAEPKAPEDVDPTEVDVIAEIPVGSAHRNFSCDTCHHSPITESIFNYDIECMDCHGDTGNISRHWETAECWNCSICHWMDGDDIGNYTDFISAGGFGMNTTPFDIGVGHEEFIRAAMKNAT